MREKGQGRQWSRCCTLKSQLDVQNSLAAISVDNIRECDPHRLDCWGCHRGRCGHGATLTTGGATRARRLLRLKKKVQQNLSMTEVREERLL